MLKRFPLIFILVLAGALTLKSLRYANTAAPDQDKLTAHELSNFLAHHGWTIIRGNRNERPSLLSSMTYSKANCTGHLTVVILTDNTELQTFVKSAMGNDLLIFENGQFTQNQNPTRLGWTSPTNATATYFGQSTNALLPPLAIAPAPTRSNHKCAPPSIKYWKAWNNTG